MTISLLDELDHLHHAEFLVVHHVTVQHGLASEIEETRACRADIEPLRAIDMVPRK